MKRSKKPLSEGATLRLGAALTVQHAAEQKQLLLAALEGDGALELDLGAVVELDSAGVQLLLLARRFANARAKRLCLGNLSPAVQEVLELFELVPYLLEPTPTTAGDER